MMELIQPIACFKSALCFKGKNNNNTYIYIYIYMCIKSLLFWFYYPMVIEGYCLIKWHTQQDIWANRLTCPTLRRSARFRQTTNRRRWSELLSGKNKSSQHAGHGSCTGCRRWERIPGSGSYFANSWNLVILSLAEDLADIYNGRLGSSGGKTDGGLLILHTVKNYTVAPAQLLHEEKTNQHR